MITTMLEMNFANTEGGLEVSLDEIPEKDLVKILFSENPGILIQVEKTDEVEKILKKAGERLSVWLVPVTNAICSYTRTEPIINSSSIICATYGSSRPICSTANKAEKKQPKTASSTTRNNRCNSVSPIRSRERSPNTVSRPIVAHDPV